MPQRILVLGASGYIGQHLVQALSQQGHQVLAAARRIERLEKQQLPNVSCHKVDLNWPENLHPAAGRVLIRFIIWFMVWAKAVIYRPRTSGGDERARCAA